MDASKRLEGLFFPLINGRTKTLCVFGCPVEHTLSPVMHNAAIAALQLPFIYIPFHVSPDMLEPAIGGVKALGIVGVNLTIPHKEAVLPILDAISPDAKAIGAVNTIHNTEGRLVGYNTDGDGFEAPLVKAGFEIRGKRAVVLGAGGAARSVVFRLAREGASVTIVNRTPDRAAQLAKDASSLYPSSKVRWTSAENAAQFAEVVADSNLLVNATSIGMHPGNERNSPVSAEWLHSGLLVYDLVYNPRETRLLRDAKLAGARTQNGVSMLVHQGAAAFKIWTGVDQPVELMEQAVTSELDARNANQLSSRH